MKIIDRLILALYSLSIAIVSLVIIVIPFDIPGIINIRDSVNIVQSMRGNYLYSLISLILFIISIRFLLSGIIGSKDIKDESFLAMRNEYGEVVIYSHTIVGLVQNTANEFSGIENINTSVNLDSGEIEVLMKGEVVPEANIPDITRELQVKVKECLENATGAKVREIKVQINNISVPTRMVK